MPKKTKARSTFGLCALFLILVLSICGCAAQSGPALPPGAYQALTDGALPPQVTLEVDGTFRLMESVVSSRLIAGTYSVDGDSLVLSAQDGLEYVFAIEDGVLTFDRSRSADTWLEDGVRLVPAA